MNNPESSARFAWLEHAFDDLRYAARMMRKSPGFTLVVVLTLGLVIGVFTTIFTVLNYQLFQPPPLETPDRLVKLSRINDKGQVGPTMDAPRFVDYQRQATSFSGLTAIANGIDGMTMSRGDEPQRLGVSRVMPNLFEVMGIELSLGRPFDAALGVEPQARHAIIAYDLWTEDFESDRRIAGKEIILDRQPYIIVGVMPKELWRAQLSPGADVWLPHDFTQLSTEEEWFYVVGRLKPGVSLARAREELRVLGAAIETSHLDGGYNAATVMPYFESDMDTEEVLFITFLIVTVVFVLLIACVNVTNLLIARSLTRGRELGLRLALGSGRGRLARQLITEFAALGMLGGLAGLLLGAWTDKILALRGIDVAFDWRVIAFAASVALLAGLLSGLAPALRFSRPDLLATLKEGGLGASAGRAHHRLRNGLIIFQIAMVLVLLVSSGLLVRSYLQVRMADIGYDRQRLAVMSISLPREELPTVEAKRLHIAKALDNLRAVPGVERVGFTSLDIVNRDVGGFRFGIQGRVRADERDSPRGAVNVVNADYLEMINVRPLRGTVFNDAEARGGAPIALINETLANRYFPGENPVGRFVEVSGKFYEVTGVVADIKNISFNGDIFAEIFIPLEHAPSPLLPKFLIRTSADPAVVAPGLREAVRSLAPNQPVSNVRSVEDLLLQYSRLNRDVRQILVFFSLLGFGLSMIGIHGMVVYSVTERTREIGIRVAMGATKRSVLLLIIRQSIRLVVVGGAIGVILAMAGTKVLHREMYANINVFDPVTYGAVFLLLALATTIASLAPALRATRVQPMTALRHE